MEWEKDIADANLSSGEKDGLQVYRNYQKAFESYAAREFVAKIDAEPFDTTALTSVLMLLAKEDVRLLPLIACSYVDELLLEMFKAELPRNIPGGKEALFGPFGPLSNLSGRLKMAYAFGLVSEDVLVDLDKVRKARNKISHDWDVESLKDYFGREPMSGLYSIERLELARLITDPSKLSEPINILRLRLIWLVTRTAYETSTFWRIKSERLNPNAVLYDPPYPKRLGDITGVAVAAMNSM